MHIRCLLIPFFAAVSTSFFSPAHAPIFTSQTVTAQTQLAQLSLEQKIGQLFVVATIVDPASNDVRMQHLPYTIDKEYIEKLITDYHIGGIIYLGTATPEQQITITNHYQLVSKKAGNQPLLIAQDLEWGLSMRLKNVMHYPHNMALGAIADAAPTIAHDAKQETEHAYLAPSLIYALGKEIGRQAQLLGVHMNLAPVMDVNNNPDNPIINDRSFGTHKENVARKALAYAHGLLDAGVLCCAKHFPGHGDTSIDSHLELPCITHDTQRLHEIELYPFKAAIAADMPAIMIAHLSIPAYEKEMHVPATLSQNIVTKLLKQELGFSGLAITDGLGMQGVLKYHQPGELELQALLAGNDILLCPMDVPRATELITQALRTGKLSESELDMHVLKILQAKNWAFAHRKTPEPGNPDLTLLHTAQAYALKKDLYSAAVTLVRDSEHLIPIAHDTRAMAYVQIGDTPENLCAKTLQQKIPIAQYHLPAQAPAEQITALVQLLTHTHAPIVVSVHQMSRFPTERFGVSDSTIRFINTLIDQVENVILVLFGNAYSVKLFEKSHAIIVAYEDDPDAQIAVAQALAGQLTPTGSLSI